MQVVIIDDEPIICDLICRLVAWEKLGLKLAGVANDGIRGLELLRQHKPEIAIIDIRIPEIDGISLIRQTNELGLGTHFLVISGYKNFEYAQQALCLNVSNYLVKPINEKELNASLEKMCCGIRDTKSKSKYIDNLQTQLTMQKRVIYDSLISCLCSDSWSYSNIEEANSQLSLHLRRGMFRIFIIKLDMNYKERAQSKILFEYLEQIFSTAILKNCFEFGLHHPDDTRLIFFCNYPPESSVCVQNSLDATTTRALNYICAYNFCDITVGVSAETETDSLSTLSERYQEAMSAVEYRRQAGTHNIIYYSSKMPLVVNSCALDEKNTKRIGAAIEALDPKKLACAIRDILSADDSICFGQRNFILAKGIVQFFFEFFDRLDVQYDNFDLARTKLMFFLDNEIHISQIKKRLEYELPSILNDYIESCLSWNNKYITIAKGYINEGYSGSITLEEVAQSVHLNPVYFSTLFKSLTGTTFTNYLQEVRIEAAKNLFKTTQHNVKSVCRMVGYSDLNYFAQLFKKSTGVTPASYRRLYMPVR